MSDDGNVEAVEWTGIPIEEARANRWADDPVGCLVDYVLILLIAKFGVGSGETEEAKGVWRGVLALDLDTPTSHDVVRTLDDLLDLADQLVAGSSAFEFDEDRASGLIRDLAHHAAHWIEEAEVGHPAKRLVLRGMEDLLSVLRSEAAPVDENEFWKPATHGDVLWTAREIVAVMRTLLPLVEPHPS